MHKKCFKVPFNCVGVSVRNGLFNWRIVKGRGRRGHTSAFGLRWACPESARDDYARVISDRKWPLKKRPVIAHIKARSKHSCLTINRNDKKKKKKKKKAN